MKRFYILLALGACCFITACGSSSTKSETTKETESAVIEETTAEESTIEETEVNSEDSSDLDIEDVKDFLIYYEILTAHDFDLFTDDDLIDMYNTFSDRLDRVDAENIGIDGMRDILSTSELQIMSEDTAYALPKVDVVELYEQLLEHENDSDSSWFDEMREYYGLTSNNSSNGDYILPDSNSRYLSADDLAGLTKDELRIARNEIYARHGRLFDSADLDEYFNSKAWYNGTIPAQQFSENALNDYEKKNAELIKSVEDGTIVPSTSNTTNNRNSNDDNINNVTGNNIEDLEYYIISDDDSYRDWWRQAEIGDVIYIPRYKVNNINTKINQLSGYVILKAGGIFYSMDIPGDAWFYLEVDSTDRISIGDELEVMGRYIGKTNSNQPVLTDCVYEFLN